MEVDTRKTRWLCRKHCGILCYGEYLDIMAEDYGMLVKVCEVDCENCKEQHDKVLPS